MATVNEHAPGTFCWPELYTPDQQGAKKYYCGLFDWEVREIPMGPAAVYTIFTSGGRDAAACYGTVAATGGDPARSHWMPYVSVASADDAAARARAAGGSVKKEPFDVPATGRMAALEDPSGAAFCVWQAKGHIGVGVLGEAATLAWTELMTTDPEGAKGFYRVVFGWGVGQSRMADSSRYDLFLRGDSPAGGMIAITPRMGPLRPCWMSYFGAESCDDKVERSRSLGGTISVPATDVPEVGRFACLVDPWGAHFGIIQPARAAWSSV